jgi:hypothetical protein
VRCFAFEETYFQEALLKLEGEEGSQFEALDPEGVGAASSPAAPDVPDPLTAEVHPLEAAINIDGASEVPHNQSGLEAEVIYATRYYATQRGTGEMRLLPDPPEGCTWTVRFEAQDGIMQAEYSIYDSNLQAYSNQLAAHQVFKLRLLRFNEMPAREVQHLAVEDTGYAIHDTMSGGCALRTEQERLLTFGAAVVFCGEGANVKSRAQKYSRDPPREIHNCIHIGQ